MTKNSQLSWINTVNLHCIYLRCKIAQTPSLFLSYWQKWDFGIISSTRRREILSEIGGWVYVYGKEWSYWSSCSQMFFKIGILKNFAIFTGKHLCLRLKHRCFPVNVAKFLRTAFFIEHIWWLLLILIKRRCILNGTLMQISKSPYRLVFI